MSRLPLLAALFAPAVAFAAPPASLPIQGYLTDDGGVPIDGNHDVRFRIYTSPTGTTSEVDDELPIDVDNGTFAAYVDVPHELYTANDELYLGLSVDGNAEMTPRFHIATAPYAARAVYADECDLLEGLSASDFRQVTDTIDFTDIVNLPTGLSDGDADTTYTAGAGLSLTGTEFAVSQSTVEGWAQGVSYDTPTELTDALGATYVDNQMCNAGFVLAADGSGGWVCTDPNSGTVATLQSDLATTQSGLATAQSDISVLQTTTQSLVTGTCPAGQSIRTVNANGTVVCENDDVGPTYTAGAGLTLNSGQFAADPAVVQSRVTGVCAAGSAIRTINANGTVVCQNTAYTASAGVTLTGTNFTADTTVLQARVTGTCPQGQYIRSISAAGAVTCEAAVRTTTGTAQRICTGTTPVGTTAWQVYSASGIYVDVNTSACGFTATPTYIVNMHGDSGNWSTTGGSSAYSRTATSFRIYVRYSNDSALTPASANSVGWHIEWMAIGP
jgi:hypothetical protein